LLDYRRLYGALFSPGRARTFFLPGLFAETAIAFGVGALGVIETRE
jgi:hypothetical protein